MTKGEEFLSFQRQVEQRRESWTNSTDADRGAEVEPLFHLVRAHLKNKENTSTGWIISRFHYFYCSEKKPICTIHLWLQHELV